MKAKSCVGRCNCTEWRGAWNCLIFPHIDTSYGTSKFLWSHFLTSFGNEKSTFRWWSTLFSLIGVDVKIFDTWVLTNDLNHRSIVIQLSLFFFELSFIKIISVVIAFTIATAIHNSKEDENTCCTRKQHYCNSREGLQRLCSSEVWNEKRVSNGGGEKVNRRWKVSLQHRSKTWRSMFRPSEVGMLYTPTNVLM